MAVKVIRAEMAPHFARSTHFFPIRESRALLNHANYVVAKYRR
jgi:hypothetical protein